MAEFDRLGWHWDKSKKEETSRKKWLAVFAKQVKEWQRRRNERKREEEAKREELKKEEARREEYRKEEARREEARREDLKRESEYRKAEYLYKAELDSKIREEIRNEKRAEREEIREEKRKERERRAAEDRKERVRRDYERLQERETKFQKWYSERQEKVRLYEIKRGGEYQPDSVKMSPEFARSKEKARRVKEIRTAEKKTEDAARAYYNISDEEESAGLREFFGRVNADNVTQEDIGRGGAMLNDQERKERERYLEYVAANQERNRLVKEFEEDARADYRDWKRDKRERDAGGERSDGRRDGENGQGGENERERAKKVQEERKRKEKEAKEVERQEDRFRRKMNDAAVDLTVKEFKRMMEGVERKRERQKPEFVKPIRAMDARSVEGAEVSGTMVANQREESALWREEIGLLKGIQALLGAGMELV